MEASVRTPRSTVRFGIFTLDLSSGELYKRSQRIRLQEQPFQVLACLLERPGQIVTREELRQRLWPAETVVGFDEGLNSAIRRLRFALGDSAENPRFIETLPRRGYRFIAKIDATSEIAEASAVPATTPEERVAETAVEPVVPPPRSKAMTALLIASTLTSIALAVVVFFVLWSRTRERSTAVSPRIEAQFTHVTSAAGVELNPTISPDGDFIVYVSRARGNEDLYLQAVGSTAPINLTSDSTYDDRQPAFSADGKQIAFRSERDRGGVFATDLGGRSVRRLTDFGYDPSWSPDGNEIVVATEGVVDPLSRPSTSYLWRINIVTGAMKRITSDDSVQPAWSPHGHRIAYWHIGRSAGQRDIATISANGGKPVPVTNDPAMDWSPSWSPDGRYLYFSSDRGGSMNLWRITIDERTGTPVGEPEAVTTPSRWSGDLSVGADGNRVVFTATEPRSNIEKIAFDPKTGKVAGNPVSVTATSVPVIQPDVSPDGQWVVFRTEGDQEDLYVCRIDGGGLRQLTYDRAKDRGPNWSPDGKRIAFYSDRGGKYEIWSINADGGGLEQLTALPTPTWMSFPMWSRDGSKMMVNNQEGSFLFDLAASRKPVTRVRALPAYPRKSQIFRAVSWTSDGKWVAGMVYRVDGTRVPGIVIHSLANGEYRVMTEIGKWVHWLSDDRRFLFSEGGALYLGDRVTGAFEEILSMPGQIRPGFSVAPDDRTVYLARAPEESDIWLLTLK